ncbi:MAG: DUF4465 domain-containing protein [Bacteroidota bacterium]
MNKYTKLLLTTIFILVIQYSCRCQTTSDFEDLVLPVDTFWDGSDLSGGFADGNAYFPTVFDTTYFFWDGGWAYSNKKDSVTGGFGNMYSARPAGGVFGSDNYIVCQPDAKIILTGNAAGKMVTGAWITNDTYPALSMRDGDGFSKKFGGNSGNDPDWFKLSVSGWLGGTALQDTVEFFLADYRFANNALDYIVTDWQYLDLSPLGNVDSLSFGLTSSDTGSFGMNTPAYFCLDNFITADSYASVPDYPNENISIFPNPSTDVITVKAPGMKRLRIISAIGSCVFENAAPLDEMEINSTSFAKGLYLLEISYSNYCITKKIMKQ